MKKEGVKYRVDLGLKWVNDKIVMPQLKEEKLKEEIDSMMPEGFSFKEGFFSSEKPSHGIWEQKKMFGRNTICCEIVRGHQDYRTPDGMATWIGLIISVYGQQLASSSASALRTTKSWTQYAKI